MEILQQFKKNGFFGPDIYYFLLSEKETYNLQMTPSKHIREIQMDTYERLKKLIHLPADKFTYNGVPRTSAALEFSPKLLLFQNYTANDKIVAKFQLKNVSQSITCYRMDFKESSYFSIKPSNALPSKLAPGISVTFTVVFSPGQYEDYTHKMCIFTEADMYTLPIIALGPRPLFDFPDEVSVASTPLKMKSSRSITVRNIGCVASGFSLTTNFPFYVTPKSAYLKPGDETDVEISFVSMHMRKFSGTLIASYETGEHLTIALEASTYPVEVYLEHGAVKFVETYVKMSRQQIITIHNRSNLTLSYTCMRYESIEKDLKRKIDIGYMYSNLKENESHKCRKLVEYDISSCEDHKRVYARIFEDEIVALVLDDTFLFQDTHFSITPLEGKLWPNTSTELTLLFSPQSIGYLEAVAYIDVDGIEGRLQLRTSGDSLAPSIKLNIETLDMDRVYIGRVYNYEIVAMNKGHISGVLIHKRTAALFGSTIRCTPQQHHLGPGEKKLFVVTYLNDNKGPYFEEMQFHIADSNVTLKLYLKGEMVYPTLSFATKLFDFGTVSLGVPKTVELKVINESTVEVQAVARVLSDGPELNSTALTDYAVCTIPKPDLPAWPKEFQIEPDILCFEPKSHVIVKITLTANLIRANQTSLEVELKDAESTPISLPIRFNALVPQIRSHGDLILKACFLNYPYHREILFSSDEFIGYFVFETEKSDPAIDISIQEAEGYIQSNSVTCIQVVIKTHVLGLQHAFVRARLFGLSKPLDICQITVCGVRPIITYSPSAMPWGNVKLLNRVDKTLTIVNDSPISVDFEASLVNDDGQWNVNISKGCIEEENICELTLSLYLVDADTYLNKLLIRIENLNDIVVPLSATGVGTSIVVGELRDHVVLGRHFTRIPMECEVVMENYGTRMHTLEWSPYYKLGKNKNMPAPFFALEPLSFKMAASEKLNLKVTAITSKATNMYETWYLIGSIEGINKKELLMKCPFEADYVDPRIELSTDAIELRYDYGPYSEHYNLTDIFTIKNISTLPLDIEVTVKPPFAFVQRITGYIIDKNDTNLCECICYNISDINIEALMRESEPYVCKQLIDYLTKKPVPPFRTEYLRFFQEINKLKLAFHLTHIVKEMLEDEEAMRLQVVFDTTKHSTLKSRDYYDLIRIKFKKHKNKDALKVTGRINFPNLSLTPLIIDFQCIPNGSVHCKTLKINNTTPLTVCYQLQFKTFTYSEPEVFHDTLTSKATSSLKESSRADTKSADELHEILASRKPESSLIENITARDQDVEELNKGSKCTNEFIISDILSYITAETTESQIFMKTITPILSADQEEPFEWAHKFPIKPQPENLYVHELFKIFPHRGVLKPGQSQYVNVTFSPKNDVNITAILECEVLGGPSEAVTIMGTSSVLKYALNTEAVDFKIRSYHEKATEYLKLLNSGVLPFDYITHRDDTYTSPELGAKILEIEPAYKHIKHDDEVDVKITIDPGIIGHFHLNFLLEIGPLEKINIDILGWGVIPQVYFSLPRLHGLIPAEICYQAISTLTPQFLDTVRKMFKKNDPNHLNSPSSDQRSTFPDFENLQEWYICDESDDYPTVIDIELSMERLLVIDHIKQFPESLTAGNKNGPVPGFVTSPYIIDYGVVIVGTTVTCCANVLNYGPVPTKLFKARVNVTPPWLEIKLCGKMNPGEESVLEVIFSPTAEYFTEIDETVETTFFLEVPYGVSIPVMVRATCAVPYLVSNISSLNYGHVRCGDKVVCSIPLKNIGKCTCIWYVTLKLKNHGQSAITILNNSGNYEPDEGGWLDIAFKPILEMTYEGVLIFKFHMNPFKLIMPVVGLGVLPRVRIIGKHLQFPPTLPGSPTSYLYFGLTNPCLFPIELIFARDDQKWNEEEKIYQILYKYYNKPGEMLVPAMMPGQGLPTEVLDFYRNLMDKVKSGQQGADVTSGLISSRSTMTARKTPKKPVKTNTPKPINENVLRYRTEAEIIADELALLKEQGADPLKKALTPEWAAEVATLKDSFGVLIFAHGSPYTEFQAMELACSIAKNLKLPVVNIDSAIVEALSTIESTTRSDLLAVVQEMYETCLKASAGSAKHVEDLAEAISVEEEKIYDYDTIHKMLYTICSIKQVGTPRSKASDKKRRKSQGSSAGDMGSLSVLLPMELLIDLMTEFFSATKFDEGFVVDTLASSILKQPAQALMTVLKCKPRIKEVQLIICHSEFSKWALLYEERELLKEQLAAEISKEMTESEVQQLIEEFEEMYASDYESTSPELRQVYINIGLEERRNFFLENRKQSKVTPGKQQVIQKDNSNKSVRGPENSATKKMKKDQGDSMTATGKKTELKYSKPASEYLAMNLKFNEYQKNTFDELVNIANNWSIEACDLAVPLLSLTGQAVGIAQKKSSKKKISQVEVQVADNNIDEPNRGFGLIIVAVPCLEKKDELVDIFVHCPVIKAARTPKEKIDVLKQPLSCQWYTVLHPKVLPAIDNVEGLQLKLLDEAPINKCECNLLGDNAETDYTNQEDIVNILSMWHCTCGKNLVSSSVSSNDLAHYSPSSQETDENYPRRLQSVLSQHDDPTRLVLQPGGLVRCKYSFFPQVEGKYDLKRFIEVAGWPESRTAVTAMGICDRPRLDTRPKKVFCDFVRRTVEDEVYKSVFLDDRKVFEFGPIFIGAYRVYEESTNFNMKNSSLMTCAVSFSFLEEEDVFKLEISQINLEPGCKDTLKVLAAPSTIGEFGNTLIGTIANNPKLVQIHLSCSGVTPEIEILPASKTIDYGKHLLYRREEERFIVKNDSILPIMWKLRNANELVEHFLVAHTSGVVDSNNNQVVIVTYVASQVGVISNKPLVIDIYDQEGRGEPMVTDTLLLSAECYDVLVDCAFEEPEDTSLNYGNVKVNTEVVKAMFFLNRGKYAIFYKIKKVKNFPDPAFLKSIEIIKDCGVIPPTMRLVDVQFVCTATVRMDLQNVPAFMCSFIDAMNNQIVVFTYPIRLSIASFYNTFTLLPLGELNFHVIPVGVIRSKEIIINNTSKCPFTYEIELPTMYQTALSSSFVKESKIDPKKPPVKKGIKCGNFTIMNDDSVLAPGASRTIEVQFFAGTASRYEEVINFIVSDTCPAEAEGVPLSLVGTGAMPSLDIWNLETTFREHLIIKHLSDCQIRETSPHCIFVESTVTLHFQCVTVNSGHGANIDLFNDGSVPAALTMRLLYQTNSDSSIFNLDKYSTHIEPLVHRNLVVNFTPKALEEYRAILEIRLKLLENQEDVYQFCLIGEGVIPRIQILEPPFNELKTSSIQFTPTLTNSVNSKVIRLMNISSVDSTVTVHVEQGSYVDRLPFWLTESVSEVTEFIMQNLNSDEYNTSIELALKPKADATIHVCYSPTTKGKNRCDVKVLILNNPYEYFTIACEGEGFNEDVTLTGLEILPMDYEVDIVLPITMDLESVTGKESVGVSEGKNKIKSPGKEQKKNKNKKESKKGISEGGAGGSLAGAVIIKYLLNLGGCELNALNRRTAVMVNHSQRVYKFTWSVMEHVAVRPTGGYLCPDEEKHVEIDFLSHTAVIIDKMCLCCNLIALDPTLSPHQMLWPSDSRQTITAFKKSREADVYARSEEVIENHAPTATEGLGLGNAVIDIVIVFSAIAEYVKYTCSIIDDIVMQDTLMYQTNFFDLEISNIGLVPMKIIWSFTVDQQYPTRIDVVNSDPLQSPDQSQGDYGRPSDEENVSAETSHESDVDAGTLYSDQNTRSSADTWFETQIPFIIEPERGCIAAGDQKMFRVTFAPKEAFNYKIQLNCFIENLDPEYSNVSLNITSKSLVPYCHLDTVSDYVTSGRRKASLAAVPADIRVLEFNVLGAGCYKKNLKIVNPTHEVYQFFWESVPSAGAGKTELVPVHCDTLQAFIPSASSMNVCFTFAPIEATVYESLWKFTIPEHSIELDLLVVGIVREPDISFLPTIVILKKTLVGDSTVKTVRLCNRENERLSFRFTGNSLSNESGKQPVMISPESGTVDPSSELDINVTYMPIASGNLAFKIFCEISSMMKPLVLCVHALSHSVKPKVTYYFRHQEHELMSDAITNIHIEKIASHYERKLRFVIKNDGSAAFEYQWQYVDSPVKKFMDINFEPKEGRIEPGEEIESIMYITLRDVPVASYPLILNISDGPEYNMYLYVDINKPVYQFSFTEYDFGKCIVNAPSSTYKKHILFTNNDVAVIVLTLNFENIPEMYVDFKPNMSIVYPKQKIKVPVYFRPTNSITYEFVLPFYVNSLVENNITITGEGVPLMFDLYEGCQKSFNIGSLRVGAKIVKEIEVMNHSKVAIEGHLFFVDTYPSVEDGETDSQGNSECLSPSAAAREAQANVGDGPPLTRLQMLKLDMNARTRDQLAMDLQNALSSLKVTPVDAIIKPHHKIPIKIHYKPKGLIRTLNMQLCMRVLNVTKPLVNISGQATGMSLCFNQNSLQFGPVRKYGCKTLKIMLFNKGDIGPRFCWQPLRGADFSITPMEGIIAARTTVTFSISFKPNYNNPFIKTWVICNIENYHPLELALYASCLDLDNYEIKNVEFACSVRDTETVHVNITNQSDDLWEVLPSISGSAFETLSSFTIDPHSSREVPIYFNPRTMGDHEGHVLFSPLGEDSLYFTLTGIANSPEPNGICELDVLCKESFTQNFLVFNLTEFPETYIVQTEVLKTTPDDFSGYYELNFPKLVKVWGEAAATCRWTIMIYEECTMHLKVMFINQETREYQLYYVVVRVKPSNIVGTIELTVRARESVYTKITVKNPLSTDLPFLLNCSNDYIKFDSQVVVSRKSEAQCIITYSPLVIGVMEDFIEAGHPLVGVYTYKLILTCLAAKERTHTVSTPLGVSVTMRLGVQNRTDSVANFSCATTNTSFIVDKQYSLEANEKGKFLTMFEPTYIGPQTGQITFTSPTAGEFVYNIEGKATEPKPQGPIEIKAGSSTSITFTNVFEDTRTFKILSDRDEFSVRSIFETIKPKKDVKVAVFLRKEPFIQPENEYPTGCLTIQCHEPAEPSVIWTYFLQGTP